MEAVAADGEVLGFTIREVNSCDSEIPEGSWMVALGLSYHCPSWDIFKLFPHMYDYHWWRKDEDGTWSHKLGANPISYTDNDGSPIYDPENCSRAPYEYILAYLIVTPTN